MKNQKLNNIVFVLSLIFGISICNPSFAQKNNGEKKPFFAALVIIDQCKPNQKLDELTEKLNSTERKLLIKYIDIRQAKTISLNEYFQLWLDGNFHKIINSEIYPQNLHNSLVLLKRGEYLINQYDKNWHEMYDGFPLDIKASDLDAQQQIEVLRYIQGNEKRENVMHQKLVDSHQKLFYKLQELYNTCASEPTQFNPKNNVLDVKDAQLDDKILKIEVELVDSFRQAADALADLHKYLS